MLSDVCFGATFLTVKTLPEINRKSQTQIKMDRLIWNYIFLCLAQMSFLLFSDLERIPCRSGGPGSLRGPPGPNWIGTPFSNRCFGLSNGALCCAEMIQEPRFVLLLLISGVHHKSTMIASQITKSCCGNNDLLPNHVVVIMVRFRT